MPHFSETDNKIICDIRSMEFPVYRKYNNGKSYFRVNSESHFTEIMFIGKRKEVYEFYAKIFPDVMLIKDMIEMENGSYEESSKEEFEALLAS